MTTLAIEFEGARPQDSLFVLLKWLVQPGLLALEALLLFEAKTRTYS